MNSSLRRYRSSWSSQGSPKPMNSSLNHPVVMFSPQRPPDMWSIVAPIFATMPGCHRPGCSAARIVILSVCWVSPALVVTASNCSAQPGLVK